MAASNSYRISTLTSPPGKNDRLFADDIFRRIFVDENFHIMVKISLKFDPQGPIDNNPALVQKMSWSRIGDKPLSEPMLPWFTEAYMRHIEAWTKGSMFNEN